MSKNLEEKFKLYCLSENLEVNHNQVNVIKKLQDYFNQNLFGTTVIFLQVLLAGISDNSEMFL